ncbi:MAG TPA: hypothetical protein VGY91_07590, partial [Chthoniobacterales bacterium]|nr:hypothetical protein [Chthoniobacterales bacterium]
MKIFVGYGYNERDEWIEDSAFRLVKAFGDEVTSGKEIFGQILDIGVRDEIARSHALIGFTTRRGRPAHRRGGHIIEASYFSISFSVRLSQHPFDHRVDPD